MPSLEQLSRARFLFEAVQAAHATVASEQTSTR